MKYSPYFDSLSPGSNELSLDNREDLNTNSNHCGQIQQINQTILWKAKINNRILTIMLLTTSA